MRIIGISGEAHSGKDTAYELLSTYFEFEGLRCTKISFAGKLKDVCALLYGWDRERLEWDVEYKEGSTLDDGSPDPACEMLGKNRRQIMQEIGTECFREGLHQDHWIITKRLEMLWGDYKDYDVGFLTDCRFLNELQFARDLGGKLIQIQLVSDEESKTTEHSDHASEMEWKQWTDWDAIVINEIDKTVPVESSKANFLKNLLAAVED